MMPSFQDIQATVGFPEYFEQAERYAVNANPPSTSRDRSSFSSPSSRSSQAPSQSATVRPAPSEGDSASLEKLTSAGVRDIQLDFIDPEPSQETRRQDVSDSSGLQAAAEEGQKVLESKKDSPEAMAQVTLGTTLFWCCHTLVATIKDRKRALRPKASHVACLLTGEY